MSHPLDDPVVGRFDCWQAYERVRAWAEDTPCGSHRGYRGPAGLTGAIIGFLDDHPQNDTYDDPIITVAAIRAHYGEDRAWWESSYIEGMHDQAQAALDIGRTGAYYEVPPPRLRLPEGDLRNGMSPWWRAALIVDRLHTTVMCAAVDLLCRQSCSARDRGLRGPSMPITPLTVESILSHFWSPSRGSWPGAYRHFPADGDLEREGKYPRLLLGVGPYGADFDLGPRPKSDLLAFPSEADLAHEEATRRLKEDGVLTFPPDDEAVGLAGRWRDEVW